MDRDLFEYTIQNFNNVDLSGYAEVINPLIQDMNKEIVFLNNQFYSVAIYLRKISNLLKGNRYQELSDYINIVSQNLIDACEFLYRAECRINVFQNSDYAFQHMNIIIDEPTHIVLDPIFVAFETAESVSDFTEVKECISFMRNFVEEFKNSINRMVTSTYEIGVYWRDPQYDSFSTFMIDNIFEEFQINATKLSEILDELEKDLITYVSTVEGAK